MDSMAMKMKCLVTAKQAVKIMNNRRLTALEGISYKMLVTIDNSKESWKALDALLYLADSDDTLHTITIKDRQTPNEIQEDIKEVVKKSGKKFASGKFKIHTLQQNSIRSKDRVIEFMRKGEYDIAALGMQGRKSSEMNPQRVMGSFSDPSMRSVTCTTLIAPTHAALPEEGESAVFVVVVDGTINSQHAYETAREWLKEGDHLYVIKVGDPRGDAPDLPRNMRSSYLGRQYNNKIVDLDNATFEVITGKKIVAKITQFCNEKGAHFLLCGTDQMHIWQNKGCMIGSVSDGLVKEAECFVIIAQLKILHKE